MKKLVLLAAAVLVSLAAHAQGTIDFANFNGSNIDAPFFAGTTAVRATGPQYAAQLFVGPAGGALVAVGNPEPLFPVGSGGEGYFVGGTRTVTGIAGGTTVDYVVRGFDTLNPTLFAETPVRQVVLGGAGQPPSVPTQLANITSVTIPVVPEPTTLALGALGLGALLLRRRK